MRMYGLTLETVLVALAWGGTALRVLALPLAEPADRRAGLGGTCRVDPRSTNKKFKTMCGQKRR
jgi:hypothetical protein